MTPDGRTIHLSKKPFPGLRGAGRDLPIATSVVKHPVPPKLLYEKYLTGVYVVRDHKRVATVYCMRCRCGHAVAACVPPKKKPRRP